MWRNGGYCITSCEHFGFTPIRAVRVIVVLYVACDWLNSKMLTRKGNQLFHVPHEGSTEKRETWVWERSWMQVVFWITYSCSSNFSEHLPSSTPSPIHANYCASRTVINRASCLSFMNQTRKIHHHKQTENGLSSVQLRHDPSQGAVRKCPASAATGQRIVHAMAGSQAALL